MLEIPDLVVLVDLAESLALLLPLARRLCPGVELVVDGDVLDRVLAAVLLLLTLVLVGVLAGATGTLLLSLRITVGCLAVLFRRMDPDREADPVEDVSVVVWQKLIGIEADSDVAHEKSSGGGEERADSINEGLSGRLMMSLSLTLRSLQLEYLALVSVMEEVVRMLRSSSVVVSITSSADPKEDVLITSAPLEGRKSSSESKELSPATAASMAATASASSASNLSSLMDEEPISLDSSMIVSVLAIRDFFVSMTELPKNLRTKRAAFSSGIPDVNSMELLLLAGCALVTDENCDDLLVDWIDLNLVATVLALKLLTDDFTTDSVVALLLRTTDSALLVNFLANSSTAKSI